MAANKSRGWLASSIAIVLSLAAPGVAPAAAGPVDPARRAGLLEAALAASSRPFVVRAGAYTTEYEGLRFALSTSGLQAEVGGGRWRTSMASLGREGQSLPVGPPRIVQTGRRLEFRRGVVAEWYRATAIGVEQGFTLSERPGGSGRLVLQLDLTTDLRGTANADGRGLSFKGTKGQTLRYDNLRAYDARGAELPARLAHEGPRIVIQVDDSRAIYPITVDPLVYLQTRLSVAWGSSVSIDGDVAVVGTPLPSWYGAAYVFARVAGVWSQQAKLTPSDGHAPDYFGYSVSLSGDTIVVGMPTANSGQGAAYVFVKPAGGWVDMTETAKLTPSGSASVALGSSVSTSGDTIVAGAPYDGYDAGSGQYQGSAYLFARPVGGWASATETAKLAPSDGLPTGSSAVGSSVSLSGGTVVAGASGPGSDGMYIGAVYVFVEPGGGWINMTETAKLTPTCDFCSPDGEYKRLGFSVSISGDTIVAGAQGNWNTSVYLFERPGGGWANMTESFEWARPASDGFGTSVSLSGDTLFVGAPYEDSSKGAAHIFTRSASGWSSNDAAKVTAPDGKAGDRYGAAVSVSGSRMMVLTNPTLIGSGAAYVLGSPYQAGADLALTAQSSAPSASVGDTVELGITLTNLGPSSATYVTVNAPLPPGLSFLSSSAAQGFYNPTTAVWNVGSLSAYMETGLVLRATVTAGAAATLTFAPSIPVADPNTANNSASVSVTIPQGTSPALSIDNVTASEGSRRGHKPFVFTVTLAPPSADTVTVSFATANGTAKAPLDYAAVSGTLTFAPGQTTQTVVVPVNGDRKFEPKETFLVNLSNPANASISKGSGTGTILNDDAQLIYR